MRCFPEAFSRYPLQPACRQAGLFLRSLRDPKKRMPLLSRIFTVLFLCASFTIKAQEIRKEFKTEIKETISLNYILDLPKDTNKPFPLILFLHGAGERGTDLDKVKAHSPFTYKNLMTEEVAILAPQCPEGVYWDTKAVYELLQNIIKNYSVDQDRIYLTGLSMGGWGSWKLADEHPEIFAAIAPVCGPLNRPTLSRACEKLADKPIWIFHGALDDIVPLQDSTTMFQKLKSCNKTVQYTIFENDNHNSWDSTYSNPKLYEWMFAQNKSVKTSIKK